MVRLFLGAVSINDLKLFLTLATVLLTVLLIEI